MYNIAIIGAGQLGSRHLQGLKKANINMSVFIVDTSVVSLEMSKKRYEEIKDNLQIKSIDYLTDIYFLPNHLDLVIIATGSIPRASLTKELLNSKKVSNIIFEKFLFPSLSDYSSIGNLLIKNNVNAWVNCTRRCVSFYKELQALLTNSVSMEMQVSGSEWGMACNSIHFIDIFAMLTGKHDFEIDTSLLENIIESKRAGYIELKGVIDGKSVSGDYRFMLTSKEDRVPLSIHIFNEKYRITISELQKKVYIEAKNGDKIEKEVKVPYQSELTGIMVEQILLKGFSDLTPYTESANLHIQFLKPIMEFYNQKTGENKDFCPIT